MNNEQQRRLSKKLSYFLRHAPQEIGLKLESGGWVNVSDLITALRQHKTQVTEEGIAYVVANCDKQRFSYDDTGHKIRANQGHSVDVELFLTETTPPDTLYHGTVDRFLMSIFEHGLNKMDRHHVHLSVDVETATKVGTRRGKPVILAVDAAKMHADGHKFYVSSNGVWLSTEVPSAYLTIYDTV